MQLKTLILVDFLSYKSETIDFPTGLVAVVGHNHDSLGAGSNGGGKSAIFDAVSWALYGKTLREIGTDDVVRVGAKSCEVALAFELDGETYFIQRTRGRSSGLTFMRGQTDLSQSTIALTQEKIDKTLGMDYRMFRVVATFQGDALRFAAATDKEQKEILEKLMGLEDYALALERVRKELNVLVPGINYKEKQIAQETGLLQIRKDEISKLELQREDARKKSAEAVQSLKDKVNACNEGIVRNNTEITSNKHLRTEWEAKLAALGGADTNIYRELAEAKSQHGAALTRVNSIKTDVKARTAALDATQSRIGKPCGECRRPLTETELGAVMESQAEKILALHEELPAAELMLAEAEQRVNQLNAKADAARQADAQRAQLHQGIILDIQKFNRQNDVLEANNRELTALMEQHKRSKLELEGVITTYDARIKDAQARLAEAEGLIATKTAELAVEKDRVEYLKFWEKGFGFAGIRSMLLDGLAEKLTEQTNRYLKILSGGTQWVEFTTQSSTKDGETREKFAVKVFNQHGAATYSGNSAGERKRVDISIALALHYLARNRASRALGFAILDEIFECLDEIGCDNVVNLLRGEKENLGTIFVVSHNPAMGTRFGSTIEVAKKDGVTSLVRREKVTPPCEESKPPSTSPKKEKSAKRARKTPSPSTRAKTTPEASPVSSKSP